MSHIVTARPQVPIPIETRSLPALLAPTLVTTFIRDPISSIARRRLATSWRVIRDFETRPLPNSLVTTLATLPSMSLILISSIPDLWQQEAVRALQPPHLTILAGRGTTSYGA